MTEQQNARTNSETIVTTQPNSNGVTITVIVKGSRATPSAAATLAAVTAAAIARGLPPPNAARMVQQASATPAINGAASTRLDQRTPNTRNNGPVQTVLPPVRRVMTNTSAARLLKRSAQAKPPGGIRTVDYKVDPVTFERECLMAHNNYRAQHGVPPLKLNSKLTALAQDWAENLVRRKVIEHRPDNNFGENIYSSGGFKITGLNPVKAWYDEILQYNYSKPEFSHETGHFTQLIWKDTKELGVGVVNINDSYVVVANYDPPGNVLGKFKTHVPPKKKKRP